MSFLTTRAKLKAAIARKRRRRIDPTPPMVKFLRGAGGGNFEVEYDAQWKTKLKAIRIGYLTDNSDNHELTPAGEAYLARYEARLAKKQKQE